MANRPSTPSRGGGCVPEDVPGFLKQDGGLFACVVIGGKADVGVVDEILGRFSALKVRESQRVRRDGEGFEVYSLGVGGGGGGGGGVKHPLDRYSNIHPWAHNRVKLGVAPDQLDYINASSIAIPAISDPTQPPLQYIAMQGPNRDSTPSVWRMVAEQQTSVIVQLTPMREGLVEKCFQYYPRLDAGPQSFSLTSTWNDDWAATLAVETQEMLEGHAIEQTKLSLHVRGEPHPRTIWHLLYLRWADHAAPLDCNVPSFFRLMALSRTLNAVNKPRIVHCSAGVGRTGTFIALEHLVRELESGLFEKCHDGEDVVFETVDGLRRQRLMMVQSPEQMAFLYAQLRRLWVARYKGADEPARKRRETEDGADRDPGGEGPRGGY